MSIVEKFKCFGEKDILEGRYCDLELSSRKNNALSKYAFHCRFGGRRRSIVDVEGGGRGGGDAIDTRDEDGRGGTTPHADCAWEEDWPF